MLAIASSEQKRAFRMAYHTNWKLYLISLPVANNNNSSNNNNNKPIAQLATPLSLLPFATTAPVFVGK